MSRDFNSYKSNLNNQNKNQNNQNNQNSNQANKGENSQNKKENLNNNQNNSQNVKENVENIYNKYKNKSEGELNSELDKYINQAKQNGSINSEQVQKFYDIVAPTMNKEQLKKLNSIIKKLK